MSRYVVQAGWDDVPHLTKEMIAELEGSLAPHQREARRNGVPSLSGGAIYPIVESDVVCDPFPIPDHFARCYGMDVGWNNTAAAWLAHDRDSDIAYLVSEYKRGGVEPVVHADAIKGRGDWIPGAIDPASRGRSQRDGMRLIDDYWELGLDITEAFNGVEAGLMEVYTRLSSGRLKIFSTCTQTLGEYRVYRRDDKGRVVKKNDHLMDSVRYAVVTGLQIATTKPIKQAQQRRNTDWRTA